LNRAGFSIAQGSMAASVLAVGGLAGSLVWGRMCDRASPYWVLAGAFLAGAVCMVCLTISGTSPILTLSLCTAVGFCIFGAYTAIAILISLVFPPSVHVHVLGVATVATRSGGLIAPIAVGLFLRDGRSGSVLFIVGAALAILISSALAATGHLVRHQN
jgi:AAHS family 4-hydroxybenzoate transporter-like MFS transporter